MKLRSLETTAAHRLSLSTKIIGYDDLKEIIYNALEFDAHVNWLFVGPPASAKSLFLLDMERTLRLSKLVNGSRVSRKGLHELLATNSIDFLLFDEMDKASKSSLAALLSVLESGRVIITLGNNIIDQPVTTKVFATCNSINDMAPELLSRFQVLRFPAYDKKTFMDICSGYVVPTEKVREEVALRAGVLSWDLLDRDIRQVIRLVRVAKTVDAVDKAVEVFQKYGAT